MAAKVNNVEAMIIYANMLYTGDGIKADKNKAYKYYDDAISNGSIKALNILTNILYKEDIKHLVLFQQIFDNVN